MRRLDRNVDRDIDLPGIQLPRLLFRKGGARREKSEMVAKQGEII